jgi:hypothetical protein
VLTRRKYLTKPGVNIPKFGNKIYYTFSEEIAKEIHVYVPVL